MNAPAKRRDDIFVSVGLIGHPGDPACRAALTTLAEQLGQHFRYWELLLVTSLEGGADQSLVLATIPNIRILKVRPETSGYGRRLSIAEEAIGDIVAISAPDELAQVDILELIAECEASESIISVRRTTSSPLSPFLTAMGRSAGFRVDLRDMLTAIYPRPLINRLLKHPDSPLALRFPPIDPYLPVVVHPCLPVSVSGAVLGPAKRRSSLRMLGYRLGIAQQIVVISAPRMLALVELASMSVAIIAFLAAIYAAIVWLTLSSVQPGWLTTSLMLDFTAMFLGFAIFGLAMGLQRLIELSSTRVGDDVVDEVNPIALFGSVLEELNIEVEVQSIPAAEALLPNDVRAT
jgi:hypothetical protein